MDASRILDRTRLWISSVVIGLNLCPFARRVFDGARIRYVVTAAEDVPALLATLSDELVTLVDTPIAEAETTLIIHPLVLGDFSAYNEFLSLAEHNIRALGFQGVIQLASFHPEYQFAGTAPDAVENYSNRSPYQMLHLLREESISAVAGDPDRLLQIPEHNQEKLRAIGAEGIRARLRGIMNDPPGSVANPSGPPCDPDFF